MWQINSATSPQTCTARTTATSANNQLQARNAAQTYGQNAYNDASQLMNVGQNTCKTSNRRVGLEPATVRGTTGPVQNPVLLLEFSRTSADTPKNDSRFWRKIMFPSLYPFLSAAVVP